MSRIRMYVVGRDLRCDVPLEDGSVSRLHAEVVRLADGGLFVTDHASRNGTFVLDGGQWRPIRQAFLGPRDHVRFGDYRLTGAELERLCPREGGGAPPDGGGEPQRRDAETGELVYDDDDEAANFTAAPPPLR